MIYKTCYVQVNGVLETQLNLMVTVNDNASVQCGDDIRKPPKAKTSTTPRKRRTPSSENVAVNSETQSKQAKVKRKYI